MKTDRSPVLLAATFLLSPLNHPGAIAFAQSTMITYQGRVTASGTNFTGTGQFKFALVTSTNLNHAATATANLSGGFVTTYTVTAGGNGYVSAPAVAISGGGGSNATAHAAISGGAVTSVSADNPGSGYSSAPTVFIAPPPPNISYNTYWSNDGTSIAGSEPSAAVSAVVSNGLFTVVLGDSTLPNMMAIDTALFTQPNLQLRIWFNDGVNGFAALNPGQNLTPAPYASFAYMASGLQGVVVQSNTNGAPDVVGGSHNNFVSAGVVGGTIGGGGATNYFGYSFTNSVTDNFGTVGGGYNNSAGGYGATVGGGGNNFASNGYSTVGGGWINIASAFAAAVGGGEQNDNEAQDGFIGSGLGNTIQAGANASVICGGSYNDIQTNTEECTISGGQGNVIFAGASDSTIGGGYNSSIGFGAYFSSIGGGGYHVIQDFAHHSTIGGGLDNLIGMNSAESTIGGGYGNTVQSNASVCTIAGGLYNTTGGQYATVGGGDGNTANGTSATVGGGHSNGSSGNYAAVPGGFGNSAAGQYSFAAGRQAGANHQGAFVWADSTAADFASQRNDQFRLRATGGVRLDVNSNQWVEVYAKSVGIIIPVPRLIDTSTGGYLSSGGAWVNSSDRNVKESFQPVDARNILEQVSALPITRWNYKVEGSAVQHIGPVAQDFQSAFGLSADDTHIATVDEGGVALAAIQGLNQKLTDELRQKEREIANLKKRLDNLERLMIEKTGAER